MSWVWTVANGCLCGRIVRAIASARRTPAAAAIALRPAVGPSPALIAAAMAEVDVWTLTSSRRMGVMDLRYAATPTLPPSPTSIWLLPTEVDSLGGSVESLVARVVVASWVRVADCEETEDEPSVLPQLATTIVSSRAA